MAAIFLYKKFFKKTSNEPKHPKQKRLCIHQRTSNIASDAGQELSSFHGHPSDIQGPNQKVPTSHIDGAPVSGVEIPCDICKQDKKAKRVYRQKLILGLFLPFLIQGLDTTIIAGALPFIASDFNQLSQLNWIITAFTLTSATFIPIWGQLADVFGRYAALQSSLLMMVLGSTLCSAAPVTAFPMLLAGRALQGIGCAGLLIVTKVILADKVSLEENAKNNTIFTIVAGSGYGFGPVLGGYLTEASWRWCFIINIPLGVAGVVLAHFVIRPELLGPQRIVRTDDDTSAEIPQTFAARLATVDSGGQFLFLFGLGLLVLALTWGGSYYPWNDVRVLAPLVVGGLLFSAFMVWEYFMLPGHALADRYPTRKAMIPLKLLFTRNAGLLIYINLVTGMALYAVYYFSDLYFALVLNFSPGKAGTNLIYYMPGLAVGAYASMFACNIWPLQTFFPLIFGTIIEPLGITLLAVAMNTKHLGMIYGMLALTGVGTGVRLMPGTLHGVAYFQSQIASIVSLMSLAVSLGGTIATTVMLNIFNNELSSSGLTFKSATSSSFDAINSLPEKEIEYLRSRAMRGIVLAFFAITAFMWLGVVAAGGLGNVRIGKKGKADQVVEKGSFLGSLIWKKGEQEKVEQSA